MGSRPQLVAGRREHGVRPRGRWRDGGAALLLFGLGLGLCLHHGRVGLMPLDQSIVFDGAWRLLQGQRPFREFVTPAGLVPIALQSLVFRLLGVSWFAYCLHAAVFNGLFAVLGFRLLRRAGAGTAAAAFFGLLGAVVFYPPFGVPYPDQHAFFFGLAALCALAEAGRARGPRTAALALAAAPWLVAAAYLSKPVPTVFVLPALGLAPLVVGARRGRGLVLPLAASTLALVVLLAGLVLSVERGLLVESLFTRPGGEGRTRILALLGAEALRGQASELLRAGALVSLLPTLLGAAALIARPGPYPPADDSPGWGRPALALALLAACAAFVMVTDNQGENGIPYVFLAAGLVHAEVVRRRVPGRAAAVFLGALALTSGLDAARFDRRVNATRMVHELSGVAAAPSSETRALPPALGFLEWRLHPFYRFAPADLAAAVAYLRHEEGALYVFGDLTLVYALTGRDSAGPTLWLHPGLTMPEPHGAGFAAWEERLLADLERRQVRFLFRESRQTLNHLRLSDLPRLAAWVEARRKRRLSFGPIDVMELRR